MATTPVSTSLKWDVLVTKRQGLNRDLRALLGSFCVSDAGIASCPAAPFAGPHQETDLDWEICAFSDYERKKADLAASLWVVAVAVIGPLPTSNGSKPFSMCRNY